MNQSTLVTTFAGPVNLGTMTKLRFEINILLTTRQTGLMSLDNPTFNAPMAIENVVDLRNKTQTGTCKMAWPFIKNVIFSTVCPGVQSRYSLNLESVKMEWTDANGNANSMAVQIYYKKYLDARQAFDMQSIYPY